MLFTSSSLTTSDREIIVKELPEKGSFYYQVARHSRNLGIFNHECEDIAYTEIWTIERKKFNCCSKTTKRNVIVFLWKDWRYWINRLIPKNTIAARRKRKHVHNACGPCKRSQCFLSDFLYVLHIQLFTRGVVPLLRVVGCGKISKCFLQTCLEVRCTQSKVTALALFQGNKVAQRWISTLNSNPGLLLSLRLVFMVKILGFDVQANLT